VEIWSTRSEVGEGPFWDDQTASLFWIDVRRPALHRHDGDGKQLASWTLPDPVGAFALLEDGQSVLVALASGLHLLDLESGALTFLMDPEPGRSTNRLNEGKVSPCGRYFVFGSMDDRDDKEATGALYCLSVEGTLRTLVTGLIVANGVAWSPDAETLYFSDSRACRIWAADWSPADGAVSGRRVFAVPDEHMGRPDGAAMDEEGCYWSAGVSAGRLNRFAPDGRLVGTIPLPVRAPTMPAFGPPGSGKLFVTSHRRIAQPGDADGAIVVVPVAQDGVRQRRFAMRGQSHISILVASLPANEAT